MRRLLLALPFALLPLAMAHAAPEHDHEHEHGSLGARQAAEQLLGMDIARATPALGQIIFEIAIAATGLSHGLGEANSPGLRTHGDKPFRIVGVLAPTGTPVA